MISKTKTVFTLLTSIALLSVWVIPNVSLNIDQAYLQFLEVLKITRM